MLLTLIPMFDENMAVKAYSIFSQKNNFLVNPSFQGTGQNDGAPVVPGLEIISSMGLDTISDDKEVFVPVSNMSVFSELETQCDAPHNRVVIVVDRTIPPVEMYVNRLKELKAAGFKVAVRKLTVSEFQAYHPILSLADYVFLNNKKIAIDKASIYFTKLYPNAKLVAGNIDTQETFEAIKKKGGYTYYEGDFYRLPITKGAKEVSPVKVTYIELLNKVNDPDFDLQGAADIIGRDTALTISLLKMVNRVVKTAEITTIRHAAAMLGQRELKRWINTAVTGELYSDKPSELTRLSLLRAKFAENLAGVFEMKMNSEELFLMGLFSVIDVILEKPIAEALQIVQVSKNISDALVEHKGKLAPVLDFMTAYENANWSEVSRVLLLQGFDMDQVYAAYVDSLNWYRTTTVRS